MFGKKDNITENSSAASAAKVDSVIGKGTEFKGTIRAEGIIRVDGRFEGELATKGDVIVGESAVVVANITARHVTIAGDVKGNVDISGKLELASSGKLLGDVKVSSIIINDGAIFKGSCEMKRVAQLESEMGESGDSSFQVRSE